MIRWLLRFVVLGAVVFCATGAAMLLKAAEMQDRFGADRGIEQPVDVAIVLGGGAKPDMVLDFTTRQRVRIGVFHLKQGNAESLIMTGGEMRDTGVTAASVMRDYAVEQGVDPSKILLEENARTTFENLRHSFSLMDEKGLKTFAIVSDDYHLARARELARFLGREPSGLGASRGLFYEPRAMQIAITLRETAAWGYNVLKVAIWWGLSRAGLDSSSIERVIH